MEKPVGDPPGRPYMDSILGFRRTWQELLSVQRFLYAPSVVYANWM